MNIKRFTTAACYICKVIPEAMLNFSTISVLIFFFIRTHKSTFFQTKLFERTLRDIKVLYANEEILKFIENPI